MSWNLRHKLTVHRGDTEQETALAGGRFMNGICRRHNAIAPLIHSVIYSPVLAWNVHVFKGKVMIKEGDDSSVSSNQF